VYLRTGWNGSVDLGGGPLTATAGEGVVGSYAPSGALRWGRTFPPAQAAGIDGCGSLVLASSCFWCGSAACSRPSPFAGGECDQGGGVVIARFAP
jgi:hypothetical protein